MATHEQIKALKVDKNVFELAEDTELEYLVHFATPFTGADICAIPKGTAFAPHSSMRGDITARGGKNAAGIGSSDGESEEGVSTCGNITISGGIVDVYGGYYDLTAAAGIGSGNCSGCGDITITTGVTRVRAHGSSTSLFYHRSGNKWNLRHYYHRWQSRLC